MQELYQRAISLSTIANQKLKINQVQEKLLSQIMMNIVENIEAASLNGFFDSVILAYTNTSTLDNITLDELLDKNVFEQLSTYVFPFILKKFSYDDINVLIVEWNKRDL